MVEMTAERQLQGGEWLHGHGDPFIPCFRCGLCCIGHRIRLSLVEARRIADGLGIAWREFEDRYVEPLGPGADSFFLRQDRGKCVFLEHELGGYKTTCLVHPFKPSSCREWTPSLFRRECQAGLAKYWGLTVAPSGQVQGSEEKLRDFYCFLRSLVSEQGSA